MSVLQCADTEINSDAEKKRVDSNDTGAIDLLGTYYYSGLLGLQQDQKKAIELVWITAAELGVSPGYALFLRKNRKKAKFHLEAGQWLDMKVQDITLEQWRHSLEIWDEL
jgi:hypothetical protein